VFSLNALDKWRLRLYCKLHGIDFQEIDDGISYSENMKHLKEFVPKSLEDLANEYARIYKVMEKETSEAERYGVIPASEEQPLLIYKTVLYLVTRSMLKVKSHLEPFVDYVKFFGRYIEVTAQITETTIIMQTLEAKGVKVQFVGRSMVYQRVWSFVPGIGWRKNV